ncbi:MAG: homocysteine S-methyltransferase family protein [Pseudomonadota bacterium]
MRVDALMQAERFYLADGGLETFMIFIEGFELPSFSAAVLLQTEAGRAALARYFERHIALARDSGRGFVLDTPTWRAGAAWAGALGLDEAGIRAVNARAVAEMAAIRARHETASLPIVLNGVIGPAGDGYAPDEMLSPETAEAVHRPQIEALGQGGVDMVSAVTLTHAGEAIGIARAAKAISLPVALSFTLETDGRLPSGQPLGDAIAEVDDATDGAAIYYMINCAHPDHFRDVLRTRASWIRRIGGLRTNASRMSHAELDAAESLDDGDPVELGELHGALFALLPDLRVVGGCCGTDHRHVGCIAHLERDHAAA